MSGRSRRAGEDAARHISPFCTSNWQSPEGAGAAPNGAYRAPRLSPSATVRDVSRVTARLRDPDGYMIEVGQATGVLHGHLAKKRPEDLPG